MGLDLTGDLRFSKKRGRDAAAHRNHMIYFEPKLVAQTLKKVHSELSGYL